MALEIIFQGGYIDGDRPLYASVADFVAGQPCQLRTDGSLELCTTDDETRFFGLFKNDKREDQAAGPQVADAMVTSDYDAGRVRGINIVKMTAGKLPAGTVDAPWVWPATAHAWAVNDEIFNNNAGKWDNQAAGGSLARGRVIEAPTGATSGSLVVEMYG